MGDFDEAFQKQLARLSWTLYGFGMFLIIARTYARIHRLGVRKLQPDDYLMLVAGSFYTILIVCLNVIATGGGSNLFAPGDFDTFTPEDIKERIHGSKIVIVSEQAMLNVIYTIKSCMLIMYTRLTLGHQIQRLVRYLCIYVAIGWVATEIAFFTACRPFNGYWAMPPPDSQCSTLQHYAIVQACFNISSDTLMLFIPLPLVTRLAVPWKQKLVLIVIFSMGVFVILAAILTKVFNLSNIFDPTYMLWYTRESSVAVYVSNLPMIWPLLREWVPFLRNLSPAQKTTTPRVEYAMSNMTRSKGTISARPKSLSTQTRRFSESKAGITTTIVAQDERHSADDPTNESMDDLDVNQKTQFWDEESTAGPLESAGLEGWRRPSVNTIHAVTTVHVQSEQSTDRRDVEDESANTLGRPVNSYQHDAEKRWNGN